MTYLESARRQAEALRDREHVRILALETSCDETAAAVIEDGRKILSNVVFSQIDLHELYGGVVPEIASRAHMEACDRVVDEALRQAGMTLQDADALAVTYGPGLVGALLTGVNCMKGLAFALNKPLVPVNHIEGHVSANFLTHPELEPPFLCLVVSGGHSHLVEVADYGEYHLIGQTVDDAAGEAFDKAARVLGLPYPGGPRIDALAEAGNPHFLTLPHPKLEGRYDFSFSGVKTAFLNAVHGMEQRNRFCSSREASRITKSFAEGGEPLLKEDLAASFRFAVCDQLAEKTERLLRDRMAEGKHPKMALAGGVSANRELRRRMETLCESLGVKLYLPRLDLCTDNGAMIGSAAYYRLRKGEVAGLELNAMPALRLIE